MLLNYVAFLDKKYLCARVPLCMCLCICVYYSLFLLTLKILSIIILHQKNWTPVILKGLFNDTPCEQRQSELRAWLMWLYRPITLNHSSNINELFPRMFLVIFSVKSKPTQFYKKQQTIQFFSLKGHLFIWESWQNTINNFPPSKTDVILHGK